MRLLKDEHTCLTPFRVNNYYNRPLPGYALSLFAETIIKKYEILGDNAFESVALVFLQTLLAEADQNEEIETRVEQTLRLLIMWNQGHEVNNQLICHPNVYLTNLRNEIEQNLSYIKQVNLSQYQQLYKLYSSEKAEQNLIICQKLITELDASADTWADSTANIRENPIIKDIKTRLETPTIKPHSLSKPFRTILASVRNMNHTPGNRELFYSSVRNQIIHHLIENKMGDISNFENVQLNNIEEIINLYQSLWAGRVSASSLQNQAQLREHIQNTGQGELAVGFAKIMELMNVGQYYTLQRLNTQLFAPERGRTISHLIMNQGSLSPEALSFLNQQSFSKSELFRIIEQGNRDEKVIVFEALNFARENITKTQLNKTLINSMSTLSRLLRNAQSNNYDFSSNFEQEGTALTWREYANRQETLVWDEIEKQVNQYKTTVSQQINNIGLLKSLLIPALKNDQVTTFWGKTQDESIFNTLGTVIEHTSVDGRESVSHPPGFMQNVEQINQNSQGSFLRNVKNYWLRSKPDLQYLVPQVSDSFTDTKISAALSDPQNPMITSLISRFNSLIMSSGIHGAPTSAGEKPSPMHGESIVSPMSSLIMSSGIHGALTAAGEKPSPMHGESIILPSSPLSKLSKSLIIRHQLLAHTTSINEVTSREKPSSVSLPRPLPTRLEQYLQKGESLTPTAGKSTDIIRNSIFNILKKANNLDMSSNFILQKVNNMIISPLKTQLLKKPYSSIHNIEISNFPRYLINQKTASEMTEQSELYFSNDGVNYRNSTVNDRADIENNAVMIMHTGDQEPRQERQNEDLAMPSQSELINKFGNLISNPNLPPAELTGRQPGRLPSDDNPDVLAKDLSITELIKKISLGEHIIREEQNKVTQIHQKVKEQEEVINNLNQAYDQLQEEMASRINERKIASMIMKELRAKLSLDKMRYGLQ